MDAPIARWSSRHFQGQKAALKAIDDELAPRKPSNGPIFPKLFALHGMGGVGKTELALQYAMQRAEDFKWVFWLSADTPISLDQSFVDIATRMQLVDSSRNADAVEATIQVKRWLAETGQSPTLPCLFDEYSWWRRSPKC